MDDALFVERRFEFGHEGVTARFYAPEKASTDEFLCRWTIVWPDGEQGRFACGEDGIQALLIAMRMVHAELIASDAYRSGKLTYLDQTDLDLPPTWGTGSLYAPRSNDGKKPIG